MRRAILSFADRDLGLVAISDSPGVSGLREMRLKLGLAQGSCGRWRLAPNALLRARKNRFTILSSSE